jgi:hypothetical protein
MLRRVDVPQDWWRRLPADSADGGFPTTPGRMAVRMLPLIAISALLAACQPARKL